MQAIRRKLNSQRGASMLMALLLMLVGIMVSAVIISAATSAAVNKRSEKEQQQAYLAVNSAAELVRDDFQSLTGRYKDVTTTVTHADGTTTTTNDTIKATCAVGDMINDIGAWFIDVNTTSTYAKTYTFSVDGYEDVSAEILVSVDTGSDGSSNIHKRCGFRTPLPRGVDYGGQIDGGKNLRRYGLHAGRHPNTRME